MLSEDQGPDTTIVETPTQWLQHIGLLPEACPCDNFIDGRL